MNLTEVMIFLDSIPGLLRLNNNISVVMTNRGGNWFTDPWVSIGNNPNGVVYAEDSSEDGNQLLIGYGGMDVFIKKNLTIPSK